MKSLVFKVRKEKDDHWGWHYIASPVHDKLGGATEARNYSELLQKIGEFTRTQLSDDFYKEAGLPKNPEIVIDYLHELNERPGAEKVVIAGTRTNGTYKINHNGLKLSHEDLDELQKMLSKAVKENGYRGQHVEFKLEERIKLPSPSVAENKSRYRN